MSELLKELKPALLPTLVELLLLGAKEGPVEITTSSLAERIGRSQQAASWQLRKLEEIGYLEKGPSGRRIEVKLTDKGVNAVTTLYFLLRSRLEEAPEMMEFRGKVFTGLGEGAHYMSLEGYKRQLVEKLSLSPFPGTLNLRLLSSSYRRQLEDLRRRPGIRVDGFTDGLRTYGSLKCFPALIEDIRGAVLIIERTHYDASVLEVIAPVSLREALSLKDGDVVTVKVFLHHSANSGSSLGSYPRA
jgi:riboflavin kinase